jgi:hypothetical protein
MTPVGPYGAHSRLQQSLQVPQTVPSMPSLQNVEPLGGAEQVPSVLPVAIVHLDEQHSESREQTSFVCAQNDEPSWHLPPVQRFEQHSESIAQVLPAV